MKDMTFEIENVGKIENVDEINELFKKDFEELRKDQEKKLAITTVFTIIQETKIIPYIKGGITICNEFKIDDMNFFKELKKAFSDMVDSCKKNYLEEKAKKKEEGKNG